MESGNRTASHACGGIRVGPRGRLRFGSGYGTDPPDDGRTRASAESRQRDVFFGAGGKAGRNSERAEAAVRAGRRAGAGVGARSGQAGAGFARGGGSGGEIGEPVGAGTVRSGCRRSVEVAAAIGGGCAARGGPFGDGCVGMAAAAGDGNEAGAGAVERALADLVGREYRTAG